MTDNITTCPDKEALVTYLYEEDDGPGRRAIEGHVEQCAACREEVSGLRRVREQLAGWEAPVADLPLPAFGPALPGVGATRVRPRARSWVTQPAFVAAAAALLVMGLAAGLANLEIRLGSDGVVIRTGWARASQPAPATVSMGQAVPTPTRVETTNAPGLANRAPGSPDGAPASQAERVAALVQWKLCLEALC